MRRFLASLLFLAMLFTPAMAAAVEVETAQHHRYRKHPDQRAPYHPRFGPIPLSRVRPIEPETLADWTAAWAWKLGRGDFNDELEFSVGYFR